MRSTPLLVMLLGSTLLFACGGDEEPTPEPEPPPEMTAVTYNAGLALGFVEATDERAPLTTERVAMLQTDVLCVQEVWRQSDQEALSTMAADTLPNSAFIDADPGEPGDTSCQEGETDDLLTCVQNAGCDQICSDKLATCALQNCAAELGSLSSSCLGCIQANIGGALDDILTTCEGPSVPYAYKGSFGIGLLTSFDVLDEDELVLESTTNRRGILYAELDTPFGPVHTFCTHLTAVFTDLDYPGSFGSWEEEQAAQIDELLTFVDDKAGDDGLVMVMGDFNTGPDGGDAYSAEVPDNYNKLVGGGLGNPYTLTPGHQCTYCADNPIVAHGNADDEDSVVIDHILIRGFTSGAGNADRILDDPIEVDNCGETITSAYSDHYGVRLNILDEDG